jgi:hypothetical protein
LAVAKSGCFVGSTLPLYQKKASMPLAQKELTAGVVKNDK